MSVKVGLSNDFVLKHQEGRPNPYLGLEGIHGLVRSIPSWDIKTGKRVAHSSVCLVECKQRNDEIKSEVRRERCMRGG
jgi:hypothetical protein